jgi:hypothetical protein
MYPTDFGVRSEASEAPYTFGSMDWCLVWFRHGSGRTGIGYLTTASMG